MLSNAVEGELVSELEPIGEWNAQRVASVGQGLAKAAGEIWFDGE